MADVKITELPQVTEVADDDQVLLIDVSDNTAGPNGTDKRSVLARLADLLFKYDVETAAELEASNPIITGRRAICRERDDANYLLGSEGYVAKVGDITASNGRVWVLQIKCSTINTVQAGADPKGIADSTSIIQSCISRAVSDALGLYLPAGNYLLTSQIGSTSLSSDFYFIGAGSNKTKFICDFASPGSGIKFFNKTGFSIGGFKIVGNYSQGSQVGNGVDCAHMKKGNIYDIEVHDVQGQGCWCISGSDQITNEDVHMENIRSYDCGSSGVQLQGAKRSGISKSLAKDCGYLWETNGGSGSGVYMKVPLEDCYHSDNTAENIPLGAFNVGSSFTGVKAVRLTWSNGRAINCKRGLRVGEVEDSLFSNFSLGLDGSNDNGLGDGLRLENGAKRNSFLNISTKNIGASRAAVRILSGTEDNNVELTSNTTPNIGSVLVTFEDSQNNTVEVSSQAHLSVSSPVSNSGNGNSYTIKGRNRTQRAEIANGSVALESIGVKRLLLDNEGGSAIDDLANITGGVEGQEISISTYNDGEDVSVAETGNIQLSSSMSLDRASDTLTLVYSERVSKWLEVSRSDNLA